MITRLSALSSQLEDRRKALGLTFLELTRECGVSRQAVYRLFHGQDVQLTTLLAVCKVLKLELATWPVGVRVAAEPWTRVADASAMPQHVSVPSALEQRMQRLRTGASPTRKANRP